MLPLLLACHADEPAPVDPDGVDASSGSSGPTTSDPETDPTDPTVPVDCQALPPMPAQATPVPGFPPGAYTAVHEDFTFSPDGLLLGVHRFDTVLQSATVAGDVTLLVPGFHQDIKGTLWLPDGRVALADPTLGALRLVDPERGGQQRVGAGLASPNGLALGPEGDLYVTAFDGVFRIDEAGQATLVAEAPGLDLDGIAFSPDFEVLYADHPSGAVLRSERRPDGGFGPLVSFVQVPIDGEALVFDVADGMATDVCGNLYVVGMRGQLVRFTPDGELDGATALLGAEYELFSAVRFGPGAGGFRAETAYVTGLLGAVNAVDLGVRGSAVP